MCIALDPNPMLPAGPREKANVTIKKRDCAKRGYRCCKDIHQTRACQCTFFAAMKSPDENDWFEKLGGGGPSLEDFLASDASQLPFMRAEHGTVTSINEDRVRYQLFADIWESVDHLQEVNRDQWSS